jgi:hypothetical protein
MSASGFFSFCATSDLTISIAGMGASGICAAGPELSAAGAAVIGADATAGAEEGAEGSPPLPLVTGIG